MDKQGRYEMLEAFKRHNGYCKYGCWKKIENSDEITDFCPYYDYDKCQKQLNDDIINFLTPRVYNKEELHKIDYAYIEVSFRGGPLMYCAPVIINKINKNKVELFWFKDESETYDYDAYGRTWRAWNMIPTEEERKKIGWNNYE